MLSASTIRPIRHCSVILRRYPEITLLLTHSDNTEPNKGLKADYLSDDSQRQALEFPNCLLLIEVKGSGISIEDS